MKTRIYATPAVKGLMTLHLAAAVFHELLEEVRVFCSRLSLSEAVDYFTQKIQHGGDWERSRPQGPKNVHIFLMTVRPLSWACGYETEMLLILKKHFWPDYPPIFSDMTG